MVIRVVTDSVADLPPEIASRYQIEVVPLNVVFGDEEFRDGVDITAEQFFARLQREPELPTTSQPSVGAFREVYERLVNEGATEILSIHVSGRLSGTLEAARQGAQGMDVRISQVDSGTASLAMGLGVITAAEAVQRGATLTDARELVESQFRRTQIYLILDTLEYLRRGGRIGRAAGLVGSMLKLKPILSLDGGEVVPVGRARTRQKAIEVALGLAAKLRPIEQAMAVHAACPDDMQYVVQRLRGIAPDAAIVTGTLAPALGVHAGPGTVAFAVVSADPGSAGTSSDGTSSADPGSAGHEASSPPTDG